MQRRGAPPTCENEERRATDDGQRAAVPAKRAELWIVPSRPPITYRQGVAMPHRRKSSLATISFAAGRSTALDHLIVALRRARSPPSAVATHGVRSRKVET